VGSGRQQGRWRFFAVSTDGKAGSSSCGPAKTAGKWLLRWQLSRDAGMSVCNGRNINCREGLRVPWTTCAVLGTEICFG